MQCLASVELLWAYFTQVEPPQGEGQLIRAFRGVLAGMRSGQRVSPRGLFSEIARQAPRFKGFQQQDAQELLRYLIDSLAEEEIKRLKRQTSVLDKPDCAQAATEGSPDCDRDTASSDDDEDSTPQQPAAPQTFLHSIFGGSLVSLVTCGTCLRSSVTVDPCFDVSLPLPSAAPSAQRKGAAMPRPSKQHRSTPSSQAAPPPAPLQGSKGRRAQQALAALRKLLRDDDAAKDIIQRKSAYKSLPPQDIVPKPTPAWCKRAGKRECVVWLLSFAPPEAVERYKLLGAPMKKLTKMRSQDELLAYVHAEYAALEERWLANDKYAPHGALHRKVCQVADPCVQRALQNCTHAVYQWVHAASTVAHDLAHASIVAAKAALEAQAKKAAPAQPAEGVQGGAANAAQDRAHQASLQPDGSLRVDHWRFPPAYPVGGQPPLQWPGTSPAQQVDGSALKDRPVGTLGACLAAFTQPEQLSRKLGNAYRCLNCGKQAARELLETDDSAQTRNAAAKLRKTGMERDACKRMCFFQAPKVLTLHLNRFRQTATGRFVKNGTHINFKRTLRMDNYFALHSECSDQGPFLYELSGIVVHGGGMGGGHYIAYTRSASGWAYASDSSTSSAPEAKALSQEAYILFYTRVNPQAAKAS